MTSNPFLNRTQGKKLRHGTSAENRTAKRLGARVHAGSGNLGEKADMSVDDFKIENKATIKDTMRLDLDWLLKVKQEALEVGKIPALSYQFTDGQGRPRKGGKWVAIPEDVFKEQFLK